MCSDSWRPIDIIGCSEVSGSWKIIAISRPRTSRSSRFESASRFRPSYIAVPSTVAPSGSSPRSARADIVLPLPLSPATPKTVPGSTE